MESSRRRSESRAGKIRRKLRIDTEITASFASNGIIDDDDAADGDSRSLGDGRMEISDKTSNLNSFSDPTSNLTLKKQCVGRKSSSRNRDVDLSSCKPCSVVLERLPEDEVQKLLRRSNFGVKNRKKNRRKEPSLANKRRRHSTGRFIPPEELQAKSKRLKNVLAEKKPHEAGGGDLPDKIVKSNDESRPSCSHEGINSSSRSLRREEATRNNANSNEAFEENPRHEASRIQNLNGDERIDAEHSEIKVLRSKRFRLSLNRNKIADSKDKRAGRQDSRTRLMPEEETANIEKAEDPRSKTSQTEDIAGANGTGFNSHDSETKASPRKHFKLSLKRTRNNAKNDVALRQDPPNKVSQLKNSNENNESSVLDLNHLRQLIKRRLDETEADEASVRKIRKSKRNRDLACSEEDKIDPLPCESRVARSDQEKPLKDPEGMGNRRNKQNISSKVENKAPKVRDLRISLEKIECKPSPSMSKQNKSIEASDRYIDIDEPGDDCQIQISEIRSKTLSQSCSIRTKDTKITDYFFKIDNSSFVAKSNRSDLNRGVGDSSLKNKYGIRKDAIVLLIDFKKLKLPGSRYSASRIEKLTQEYANSFINIDYKSRTTNALPLSSSPSNKFSLSFNDLSTNDEQSFTDITHFRSLDHVDKPPHDSSQTHSIPITKNLSPKSLSSPQGKKPLPVTHISIDDEETSADFTNVHNPLVQTSNVAEQIQTIPILDHVLSIGLNSPRHTHTVPILETSLSLAGHKSPEAEKHSPTKITPDSLNDNLLSCSGTPRSSKEKETSNNVRKDLDNDQEAPGKNSSPRNSSELKATPHSSPVNSKDHENRSSDSPVKNTTPKSTKTLNISLRKLALTPQKRIVLINDEIPSNEIQIRTTDASSESPNIVETQKTSNLMAPVDTVHVSSNGNELRKKPNSAPVPNKDSNIVEHQPDSHPAPLSVLKSPTNMQVSRANSTQGRPRHLPVNSMTILSCEMIEENSSWMGLDSTVDNTIEDNATTAKNHTVEENASINVSPSDDTMTDKAKTSCDTTQDDANNFIGDGNADTSSMKSLVSNDTQNVCPEHLAGPNAETSSSKVGALTESCKAQETVDAMQHRDSVSEVETFVPSLPSQIATASVENPIDPGESLHQQRENSDAQDEDLLDSQQGQLVIDTDESDSDSRPVDDVLPGTSSLSAVNSNIDAVVQDEDACKKTASSPGKKCILCSKTFKTIDDLEEHLGSHITVAQKSRRCHICDKSLHKKNAIEHYLEHCGFSSDKGFYPCDICTMKFRKKSYLSTHMRSRHGKVRSKVIPTSEDYNKCTICQVTYNSQEELFSHVLKHTSQELQDAFAVEKAKLDLRSSMDCQNQDSDAPEKEKTGDKEQSAESTQGNDTLPKSPPTAANFDVSICMCHKDERLEISGGVIIEIALTCIECKTFFKTRKCFKDHYNSTSCTWSDETVVTPKMFCNKCCTILDNLQDMHGHLAKHGDVDVDTKTSVLCKSCNVFFFGIGSLFYAHWSEHRKNPLFLAEHLTFLKNTKVKIVQLGGQELTEEDEPSECLFIADHQCKNCEKPFQTEDEFKKHLKSCSKKVDAESQVVGNPKSVFKLICSICNKEFVDKSTFDSHIEEHDSIKDLLRAPKSLYKSLENNQLICSICKTKYDTMTSYKEHLKRHEVIQEKFLCNYCTLMMDSVEDFASHSTEHKGTLEKPVSCKVIFAINKFHCKVCKIWLDDQSALDEHLATHTNSLTSSSPLIENLITETVPAIEEKRHMCATCQEEFDDQLKLDAHVATHNKNTLGQSVEDPILIHLSDDSNSTDIEIIATETNAESVVRNNLLDEQQEKGNTEEPKKSTFLRVKNLKELLPYDCSRCKSEFDTQINLTKHVCIQNVNPTQDREYNYFCRICKSYPCDNDSDWNLHVLSHYPLQCSQKFNESWFSVFKMQCGQQIFKCNMCPNYDSLTIHTMRRHFMLNHPDIYHPIFKCRVCHVFKTTMEHEIRRHEAAHFQQPSPLPPLVTFANNLLSIPSFEISNNSEQPVVFPAVGSSSNDTFLPKPAENSNNSNQPDSMPSFNNLGGNLPPRQSAENINNFQQPVINLPVIRSSNNSSSLQSLQNLNNFQQNGSTPPVTNSGNNLPSIKPLQSLKNVQQPRQVAQPANSSSNLQQSSLIPSVTNTISNLTAPQPADDSNNSQRRLWIPPVTSSADNLPSLQPLQGFNKSQEAVQTCQPNNNSNNFQVSIPIPSVTISGSNLSSIQPVENSNKSQQQVTIPPVISSGNNLPLNYFISSQRPGPTLQLESNPNNVQQSISIPPVTSTGSNLASLQSMDNPQWLTSPAPTFQLQISGTPPLNNMNNVHTVPLYLAKVIYSCRICKVYKCSSEHELKIHESLHEFLQLGETSKGIYRCKLCINKFCKTEDQLKAHMQAYHKSDKSNVLQDQTQSNVIDTQSKCKHCFQTFPSSVQLFQHIHTAHTLANSQQDNTQFQNSYPYPCQICSIGFLNEAFLHAHMRQIHPHLKLPRQKGNDPKTLYQCDTCGLLLISEATLNYHMRSHNVGFD